MNDFYYTGDRKIFIQLVDQSNLVTRFLARVDSTMTWLKMQRMNTALFEKLVEIGLLVETD